jgi:hypothetical protein
MTKQAGKPKQIRDSFTMPKDDYALIDILKMRAVDGKRPAKKSELLRAGLHALLGLNAELLSRALNSLAPVKTGRPKSNPEDSAAESSRAKSAKGAKPLKADKPAKPAPKSPASDVSVATPRKAAAGRKAKPQTRATKAVPARKITTRKAVPSNASAKVAPVKKPAIRKATVTKPARKASSASAA